MLRTSKRLSAKLKALIHVGLMIMLSGALSNSIQATLAPTTEETTITSDQLELVDNGAKSIFTGHVKLKRFPYVLTADRMTRIEATGVVEAVGHIVGTWLKPNGEKTTAIGERARFNPLTQTTELWEEARLSHWDSGNDPNPLIVTAGRFIAHHDVQTLVAKQDVIIRRGATFESHSDEAKYDQNDQMIHLWGTHKTTLQWADKVGSGHFLSDRAQLLLSPMRARLIDQVTGHLIPATR